MAKKVFKEKGVTVEVKKNAKTTKRSVKVIIDDRDIKTSYANAFRANSSAEELILDLGFNMVDPNSSDSEVPDVVFKIDNRVIMNFYAAKRLALTLGQHVRRYEEQYGELELDLQKRS